MKFYLVDTYSSAAITRQPACVVIVEKDQDMPNTMAMNNTAIELGYSDIVFMQQQDEENFYSRYFSNGEIIPFKINSTIAAYTVLYKEGLIGQQGNWTEDTGTALLHININDGFISVETPSAENLTRQLNISDEDNLFKTIGIESEQISLKSTADYFRATLPGVISKMLPEIKTPLMNLNTLMALFQEMAMSDEIKKSVEGTPLADIMTNEALDPMFKFMNDAFKGSDTLTKSMNKNKEKSKHKVMAVASPMLPSGNPDSLIEQLNLSNDPSASSYGVIMKRKENDAIQFCGSGTVMAEGQIFI